MWEMGAGTSPHRIRRAKSLMARVFRAQCGGMRGDQLEDSGAVACVSPAHPPKRAALGRWSVVRTPVMVSGAGIERGLCRGQKSKRWGTGITPEYWASGSPRLTELRLIGSCPIAVCAVGCQGALRRHERLCGAHKKPPGRMWRPGIGFGFRSSNSFVHPDARKLALECVSTADMGGACRRRASPPSLRPGARGELRRRCGRGRRGVG